MSATIALGAAAVVMAFPVMQARKLSIKLYLKQHTRHVYSLSHAPEVASYRWCFSYCLGSSRVQCFSHALTPQCPFRNTFLMQNLPLNPSVNLPTDNHRVLVHRSDSLRRLKSSCLSSSKRSSSHSLASFSCSSSTISTHGLWSTSTSM